MSVRKGDALNNACSPTRVCACVCEGTDKLTVMIHCSRLCPSGGDLYCFVSPKFWLTAPFFSSQLLSAILSGPSNVSPVCPGTMFTATESVSIDIEEMYLELYQYSNREAKSLNDTNLLLTDEVALLVATPVAASSFSVETNLGLITVFHIFFAIFNEIIS